MVNRKKLIRSAQGKEADRELAQPVSEKLFLHYVDVLKAKIEFSRKDMGEQVNQLATGLGKRIERVEEELKQTQNAVKATREDLTAEIRSVETRLTEKIEAVDARLTGVETRLTGVETRLSDKIDSIHVRLDDHEVRIATLEAPAKP